MRHSSGIPLTFYLFLAKTITTYLPREFSPNDCKAVSPRSLMCPAEENANYGRLRPTNARKNSEKIDTRTNKVPGSSF